MGDQRGGGGYRGLHLGGPAEGALAEYTTILSRYLDAKGGSMFHRIGGDPITDKTRREIEGARALLPGGTVLEELKQFAGAYRSKIPGFDVKAPWDYDFLQYCTDIATKIRAMNAAVKRLTGARK